MAYPLRQFEPQTLYFITARTQQSRLLMRPSRLVNGLIGGVLARAVRQYGVELFGYVFLSNHFHLLARAPSPQSMSRFMQRLQTNLAVKVGRLVDWRGAFFARRYSAEPIIDDAAQVERLAYVLSHGVKEGLVSRVEEWPGLSCARPLLDGVMSTQQRWFNWTRRWRMEFVEHRNVGRFTEECPGESEALSLTPLPAWAHLTADERRRLVVRMVDSIDAAARGRGSLGPRRVAAQHPHTRPQHSDHRPRPIAHASSTPLWAAAVQSYRSFRAAFRRASRQWLAGTFDVQFPAFSMRPPAWTSPVRIV